MSKFFAFAASAMLVVASFAVAAPSEKPCCGDGGCCTKKTCCSQPCCSGENCSCPSCQDCCK